jgi:hypothetical protein
MEDIASPPMQNTVYSVSVLFVAMRTSSRILPTTSSTVGEFSIRCLATDTGHNIIQNITVSHLPKTFSASYGNPKLIVFTRIHYGFVVTQMNPVLAHSPHSCKIFFLIFDEDRKF